jgi:hypothetical protein
MSALPPKADIAADMNHYPNRVLVPAPSRPGSLGWIDAHNERAQAAGIQTKTPCKNIGLEWVPLTVGLGRPPTGTQKIARIAAK